MMTAWSHWQHHKFTTLFWTSTNACHRPPSARHQASQQQAPCTLSMQSC